MECDLDIFESKVKEISRAILTKECTLEDVLTDIKECGFGLKQSWEALEKACVNLKCSKLKGRVGVRGDQCYLEVMILSDVASLVLDVMTASLSKASTEQISSFFTSKAPEVVPRVPDSKERDDGDTMEEVVLVENKKIEDVEVYIDVRMQKRMHLFLPEEDMDFEGSVIDASLGPLSLDLRQRCWYIDLTLSSVPKGFSIPSQTKSILVRFAEK